MGLSHRILLVYKADFILKCFFFFSFFIVDNVEFTYQPRFYNNVFTNFEKLIDVNFFSNMYFLIFIIQINSTCGTHVLQGLQGRSRGSYFLILAEFNLCLFRKLLPCKFQLQTHSTKKNRRGKAIQNVLCFICKISSISMVYCERDIFIKKILEIFK